MNLVLLLRQLHGRSNIVSMATKCFLEYIIVHKVYISRDTIFNFYWSCAVEPLSVKPRSENEGTAERNQWNNWWSEHQCIFSESPFFSEAGFNLKSCTSKTKTKSNFEKSMWREGETLRSFSFKRFVVCKTKRLVVRKGRVSKEINHSQDHLDGEYIKRVIVMSSMQRR